MPNTMETARAEIMEAPKMVCESQKKNMPIGGCAAEAPSAN